MRARLGDPVGRVGVGLVFHIVVAIVLLVDIRVVSAERERVQLRVSGKSCFYLFSCKPPALPEFREDSFISKIAQFNVPQ